VHADGNINAWGCKETITHQQGTAAYQVQPPLKLDSSPEGLVEVVDWATPSSLADLVAQFGKLLSGHKAESHGTPEAAPPSAEMER